MDCLNGNSSPVPLDLDFQQLQLSAVGCHRPKAVTAEMPDIEDEDEDPNWLVLPPTSPLKNTHRKKKRRHKVNVANGKGHFC